MKNKRHNWPQVLKHFDQSKLSVSKYAKKYKVAESSLYAKLKERSEDQSQSHRLLVTDKSVHEITLQTNPQGKSATAVIIFQIKTDAIDLNFYDLPNPKWLAEVLKVFK